MPIKSPIPNVVLDPLDDSVCDRDRASIESIRSLTAPILLSAALRPYLHLPDCKAEFDALAQPARDAAAALRRLGRY